MRRFKRVRSLSGPITAIGVFVALAWAGGARADVVLDPAEVAAPYRGRTVAALDIRGVPGPLVEPLRAGLASSGTSSLVRTAREKLYPRVLAEDVDRVRLYLATHGYPRSTVAVSIVPLDGARVRVVLDVDTGHPIMVRDVRVNGLPEGVRPTPDPARELVAGVVFTDAALTARVDGMVRRLKEMGYPFAAASPTVRAVDDTSVVVRVDVTPGEWSRFGEIRVSGTREDLVPLVRRATGIHTGSPYSPVALRRAETTLRLLALFRQVRLDVVAASKGVVDVVVSLVDRAPRTLEVGGGYWTDELLRGQIRWQHRNLFGGGRGFQTGAQASAIRQQVDAGAWWPAVLGSNVRAELDGLVEHRNEESYKLLLTQGQLALRYQPTFRSSYRIAFQVSRADVEILTDDENVFQERPGLVTSVVGLWSYEGADDRLNPTRGRVGRLSVEQTLPDALSGTHFVRVEAALAGYMPVPRATLAARARVGWARPLEDSTDLLPNDRFFAGGSSSMRGFRRNELGPVDGDGKPVGGEAKLELGTELRIPVRGPIALAAFVDAGQVWAQRGDIALDTMEVAVGGGLMVITPIGPIRLDVGHRLTDVITDAPETVYHLSIGQPY